jgi:hypothetical protein
VTGKQNLEQSFVSLAIPSGGLVRVVDGAGMVEPIAESIQPVAELDRRPVPEQVCTGEPAPGRRQKRIQDRHGLR